MLTFEEVFQLGYVRRVHGVSGSIIIELDSDDPAYFKKTELIYLDVQGKLIPFFVKSWKMHGVNQAILQLEDIDDTEAASELMYKGVYLPLKALKPLKNDQFYFHELIGVRVVNEGYGEVGIISALYEPRDQVLAGIDVKGKEVLFPLADPFIIRFDREVNTLYTRMPDGLIDLYIHE